MSNTIINALDLSPQSNNELTIIPDDREIENTQEQDIDTARDGLYDALSMSQQAVQDLVGIAQQSQHPKAYEVLNNAIKTMADISMGLAELQLKKQRLMGKKEGMEAADQQQTINNLFVGSTAELQKMIEDMKNK